MHWGSKQQEELRYQVTYHAYLASRVTVTHTKRWSCWTVRETWFFRSAICHLRHTHVRKETSSPHFSILQVTDSWQGLGTTRLPGDKAFLLVFLWCSTKLCLLCRELAGTDVIMSPARRSVRLAERGVKCSAEKMVLPSLTQVPDDVDFAYCPNNALLWSLWSLIMKDCSSVITNQLFICWHHIVSDPLCLFCTCLLSLFTTSFCLLVFFSGQSAVPV